MTNEIECPDCEGWGSGIVKRGQITLRQSNEPCPACNGTGWRAMTADEYNNACEDAYTAQFEGEPPLTMNEQAEMQAKKEGETK